MTKEQLIDSLSKVMTPLVEKFAEQPSPDAAAQDDHRKELETKREQLAKLLGEGSSTYAAASADITDQLKSLKVDSRTQRKQNLQLAAEAVVTVANMLRVPLKLRDTGTGRSASASKVSSGGKRARKSNAQMAQETAAVLKALPSAKKDFVAKGVITDKVGFDPQSALLKLKRDGEAESNGVRGAGGGWRRAG